VEKDLDLSEFFLIAKYLNRWIIQSNSTKTYKYKQQHGYTLHPGKHGQV